MTHLNYSERGSIALGMVFGIGILGLAVAASTLLFTTSSIRMGIAATAGADTLVVADAAAREGMYQLLQDENYTTGTIPPLNNTHTAHSAITGSWPLYEVRGVAASSLTERRVVAEMDLFPSAFAFDHAVYSHGQISANGNLTINGSSYATNGITLSGNASISGDAYTPLTMNTATQNRVSGTSHEQAETILPPSIDINPYRVTAQNNETYFTNLTHAKAYIESNPNGNQTVFVENTGTLSLNRNNLNFNGVIITTGSLSLNGGTIRSAGPNNPLALYVANDFTIRGNATVEGVVFVGGDTSFGNGTNRINGVLLSSQPTANLNINGNAIITYNPALGAAWQQITGLDKESGTNPKIRRWFEE